MTEKRNSIAREQAEFITDFNEIGDWLMQYSCLLELTADMKPVLPEEKNSHTKISGCQADLWVVLSYENDNVYVRADSDSLIVKGIVAVIVALFDARTPREICETHIDFIEKTALKEQISVDRFYGMQTVVKKIQSYALKFVQSLRKKHFQILLTEHNRWQVVL